MGPSAHHIPSEQWSHFPLILGPTAVGKSEIAIELAASEEAEIISCDSRAVFQGMDIGTAKPSPQIRQKISHHLIDIKNPQEHYDVMDFRRDVKKAIEGILSRNRYPILVGGSTLYVGALTSKFFRGPSADHDLRKKLKEKDPALLYQRLKEVDPEAFQRIHPNDQQRIIRALEVYKKTGQPISKLQERDGKEFEYDFLKIGLRMEREKLYQRINKRVDKMMERDLLKEVKRLKPHLDPAMQAYKTIGYQELFNYLNGKISLEEAVKEIKKNTRHLAKRQLIWFKGDEEIRWIEVTDKASNQVAEKIKSLPNYPQF